MAISNGIKGMISGSAGDLTYSVKGGELVISARVSKMTNPRTPTQMIQRIKFPNIVALYRSFRGLLDECFEQRRRKDRKSLVPIYNRFIGANLFSLPVYLTRTESATGYCIAAPSFGFSSAHGCLSHGEDIGPGAFAWVHTRYTPEGLQASTQRLVLHTPPLQPLQQRHRPTARPTLLRCPSCAHRPRCVVARPAPLRRKRSSLKTKKTSSENEEDLF
ncbi:hypothetical protein [uncultured Bacteroides sp.]|uniref:hypothetical protein n=1 Tax=uncultured Bacteroides sp. TaxID=162156 RepID=UPI0025F8B7AF|nr:hypothetical protein [uncultured Bacteroides sp.]